MEKFNILVCDGMDQGLFSDLKKISEFNVLGEAKNNSEVINSLKKQAHALVIRSATKPDQAFLDECENLKYIIRAGEGTDNIEKSYCEKIGVKVSNTPGANNNSAAEHAVALMMTLLRKTAWANDSMQTGTWNKAAFTGNELTNKKVGIVGFGRIGQLVAKRLIGFDPEIFYFDPYCDKHKVPYENVSKRELEFVFENSDIVTVHVPLLDSTKNLIDYNLFSKMKPTSIFVNAARGGIVNEQDLLKALKEKKLKAAAMDVFATEPLKEKTSLHGVGELLLTPHLGGSTEEAQFRVGEMAVHQLKEFFINKNLLNEVKA